MHHWTWLDQEMLYIAHNPQKILEKVTSCCPVLPSIYFIHLLLLWTWHMPLQGNEKDNKYLKEMKEAQMCCSKECQVRFSIHCFPCLKIFGSIVTVVGSYNLYQLTSMSLGQLCREERKGFCAIILIGSSCLAIVALSVVMLIHDYNRSCQDPPPPPPTHGFITFNQTEEAVKGSQAVYDCLPEFR